jgi:hypothetical protein
MACDANRAMTPTTVPTVMALTDPGFLDLDFMRCSFVVLSDAT